MTSRISSSSGSRRRPSWPRRPSAPSRQCPRSHVRLTRFVQAPWSRRRRRRLGRPMALPQSLDGPSRQQHQSPSMNTTVSSHSSSTTRAPGPRRRSTLSCSSFADLRPIQQFFSRAPLGSGRGSPCPHTRATRRVDRPRRRATLPHDGSRPFRTDERMRVSPRRGEDHDIRYGRASIVVSVRRLDCDSAASTRMPCQIYSGVV